MMSGTKSFPPDVLYELLHIFKSIVLYWPNNVNIYIPLV